MRRAMATGLVLSALAACVNPNVVVVDQKTALEQQAAGDYPELENQLEQAGMSAAPEPFAREELASSRERSGGGALGELAEIYQSSASDADAISCPLTARMTSPWRSAPAEGPS